MDPNGHKHILVCRYLGWELYNRTAGDESTPMKNNDIRYNSVTDSIDTPTQFITFHDAHTQKCTVRGWRVYTSTTFSYSAQELFSPVDHNGHKHILVCRVLVGNYTTGQQGMKVPLWKMTKSDLIQWQIPSTHPHNSSHSMTLITFSLHAQTDKLTDGQLYNI